MKPAWLRCWAWCWLTVACCPQMEQRCSRSRMRLSSALGTRQPRSACPRCARACAARSMCASLQGHAKRGQACWPMPAAAAHAAQSSWVQSLAQGMVQVKDLSTGEQRSVAAVDLLAEPAPRARGCAGRSVVNPTALVLLHAAAGCAAPPRRQPPRPQLRRRPPHRQQRRWRSQPSGSRVCGSGASQTGRLPLAWTASLCPCSVGRTSADGVSSRVPLSRCRWMTQACWRWLRIRY